MILPGFTVCKTMNLDCEYPNSKFGDIHDQSKGIRRFPCTWEFPKRCESGELPSTPGRSPATSNWKWRQRQQPQLSGRFEAARKNCGRNSAGTDLCPCGSGRKFQEVLPEVGPFRRREPKLLPAINKEGTPSGALFFCLAEFLQFLVAAPAPPDALKSGARIAIPNCAKAAQCSGALVLGTPGLRQRGGLV